MEISQYLDFDFLIRFLEGLQKFLGENSEILIHDYRKGYDHTIVYALNPAVSGRAVGGSPKGGMITQLGKDIEPMKDSIQTFSNGPKDRFYKSFTTLIPDENGKVVGSVCVNLDVSDLLNAQRALGAFVQYPMTHHAPTNDIDALATKNVDDILKYYMILIYLYSGLHFSQLFSTCIAANKKPILLELFLCHLNNTFMFLRHSVIINSNQ